MARRQESVNLISFMDVMCCGFGAIILLFVIIVATTVKQRAEPAQDLSAELARATALEEFAREELARRGLEIAAVEEQQAALNSEIGLLQGRIRDATRRADDAEARSQAVQASIASLRAQSAAMEQAMAAMRAQASQKWDGGKRPVGFTGDGQRQYLTGLKLGGERTLILVDASASMLDETVVNVVRWKLQPPETRRMAPKWQRTVRTLHWLTANLRPDKQVQIYQFSTDAKSLIPGSDGKWLSTNDTRQLSAALVAARDLGPTGGTSLHRAFAVIDRMEPAPDSVILITDGLPTQGRVTEGTRIISADERMAFFTDAVRTIRKGIPVNTLLLPMEGDPTAAGAFWQLAISTQGSFITPARDWP